MCKLYISPNNMKIRRFFENDLQWQYMGMAVHITHCEISKLKLRESTQAMH